MALMFVLTLRHPGVAAGVLLCTYSIEQWTQARSQWFFVHGTLTNYLTGLLVVTAIVVNVVRGKPILRNLPANLWWMFAIYIFALISLIWSINSAQGWALFKQHAPTFIIFGFLPPLIIIDRDDLKAMLYTLMASGFGLGLLLLTTTTWSSRNVEFQTGSVLAGFGLSRGNPLAVATLGAQMALVVLLMNFRGTARVWQILRYVIFGVGLALSVKSGSRGQAIGLMLVSAAMFPLSRRFKDFTGFIGFIVSVAVMGTVAVLIFDTLTSQELDTKRWTLSTFSEAYGSGRLGTSMEVLSRWITGGPFRWVLGLGSNASYAILGIYPHVVVLEVLGELGFVGFSLLMMWAYTTFRTTGPLWRATRENPQDRGMAIALTALFLFEVLMSFKQGSLLPSATMFALSINLARISNFYASERAFYEQLDAGGYAMTSDERAVEQEYLGERGDSVDEFPGELQPARI